MPEHMDHSDQSRDQGDVHARGRNVTITVDSQEKHVHRGSWIVHELKAAVGVEPGRVLDQVVAGEFLPLDDNARVTIKGAEVFVSHVRQGGAS